MNKARRHHLWEIWTSLDVESVDVLILDFPGFRTVKIKKQNQKKKQNKTFFLLFINYLVYATMLKQPEWTKSFPCYVLVLLSKKRKSVALLFRLKKVWVAFSLYLEIMGPTPRRKGQAVHRTTTKFIYPNAVCWSANLSYFPGWATLPGRHSTIFKSAPLELMHLLLSVS